MKNINYWILFFSLCIIINILVYRKKEAFYGANHPDNHIDEDGLEAVHDFTKVGLKGEKGDLGLHLLEQNGFLHLGGSNRGTSGETKNKSTQLLLGGKHNQGANNGKKGWTTYKLKIEGYDNDGSVVFPIYISDENNNADFYIRNRLKPNPTKSEEETLLNLDGRANITKSLRCDSLEVGKDGRFNQDLYVNRNLNVENQLTIKNKIMLNNLGKEKDLYYHLVPMGTIIAFHLPSKEGASYKNIPKGWAICDGKIIVGFGKTPDLQNRFIRGACPEIKSTSNTCYEGRLSGDDTIKLNIAQLPSHNHPIKGDGFHEHLGTATDAGSHAHTIKQFHANFRHGGKAIEGSTKDDEDGSFTQNTDPAPAHSHPVTIPKSGGHTHESSMVGSGSSINIEPKFFMLIYIIKVI